MAKLAEPRVFGRRGPAKPPLKEFGVDPVSNRPVVAKDGKFGTYVTDGETNASLTRGDRIEFVTAERAFELLAIRRDYTATNGPSKKRTKKAAKPKKSVAKKATKSSAEKTAKKTVKKAAAKKTVKKAKTGAKVTVAATESAE